MLNTESMVDLMLAVITNNCSFPLCKRRKSKLRDEVKRASDIHLFSTHSNACVGARSHAPKYASPY